MIGFPPYRCYPALVKDKLVDEQKLGSLAKQCREAAGKSRAEVARELKVARPTIFQAEEDPDQGLLKLRKRIIEAYSEYEVVGPMYLLRKKR